MSQVFIHAFIESHHRRIQRKHVTVPIEVVSEFEIVQLCLILHVRAINRGRRLLETLHPPALALSQTAQIDVPR